MNHIIKNEDDKEMLEQYFERNKNKICLIFEGIDEIITFSLIYLKKYRKEVFIIDTNGYDRERIEQISNLVKKYNTKHLIFVTSSLNATKIRTYFSKQGLKNTRNLWVLIKKEIVDNPAKAHLFFRLFPAFVTISVFPKRYKHHMNFDNSFKEVLLDVFDTLKKDVLKKVETKPLQKLYAEYFDLVEETILENQKLVVLLKKTKEGKQYAGLIYPPYNLHDLFHLVYSNNSLRLDFIKTKLLDIEILKEMDSTTLTKVIVSNIAWTLEEPVPEYDKQ